MSTISDLAKAAAYKLAAEVETSSPSKALLPESVVAASPILPTLATLGYVQTAMKGGRNAKGNKLSSKEIDKFEAFWRKSDAARGGVSKTPSSLRSGLGSPGDFFEIGDTPVHSDTVFPPHYNPKTRQVVINPNWAKSKDGALGVLAHELGHAEQFRDAHGKSKNFKSLFGKFNQLKGGKILGSLGTLAGTGGAYWSDDRDTAFNSALAGSASNIPTLTLEAGASARGSRTLVDYAKQTGIWKNKNALQKLKYAGRSWIGVPTYLMAASVPLVVYLARRAGGQLPDKKAVLPEKKASFSRLWNKTFPKAFRIRQAKDLVPAGVHALGLGAFAGAANEGGSVSAKSLRGAGTGVGATLGAGAGLVPGMIARRSFGGGGRGLAAMLGSTLLGGYLGGKTGYGIMDGFDEVYNPFYAKPLSKKSDDKSGYKKANLAKLPILGGLAAGIGNSLFRTPTVKPTERGLTSDDRSMLALERLGRGFATGASATTGAMLGAYPGLRWGGKGKLGLLAAGAGGLFGGLFGGRGAQKLMGPNIQERARKSGYTSIKQSDDCHCYPGGPADPDKKGCKDPDCDHCGKATKKAFTTPSATPAPKMSPGYKPTPPRGGNLSMGRVAYNTKPPAKSPAPAGGQLPSWVKKQYQDPAKYKFIPSEYANSGRMVNRQTGVVEQSYDDPKALQQYLNNIMKKRGSDIQALAKAAASAAWQRKAGKNSKGGLNEKGRKSYERENPGSDLKAPVTGKVKPGGKAAKRRKSFCARMKGNKGPMKKPNGEPTRKALALRKWKC